MVTDVRVAILATIFIGFACVVASVILGFLLNDFFHVHPWGWLAVVPPTAYLLWLLREAWNDW